MTSAEGITVDGEQKEVNGLIISVPFEISGTFEVIVNDFIVGVDILFSTSSYMVGNPDTIGDQVKMRNDKTIIALEVGF